MSTAIQNMANSLRFIKDNLDEIVLDLVKDREKEVIAMNTDDQLFQGFNTDGEKITPPYSEGYVKQKKRSGNPYDRVTTRESGDYHDSFFITYDKDQFFIDADDFKKPFLFKMYSEKLHGLTIENIDKLSEMIKEPLIEEVRKRLTA